VKSQTAVIRGDFIVEIENFAVNDSGLWEERQREWVVGRDTWRNKFAPSVRSRPLVVHNTLYQSIGQ
jgi:hypothetical protein